MNTALRFLLGSIGAASLLLAACGGEPASGEADAPQPPSSQVARPVAVATGGWTSPVAAGTRSPMMVGTEASALVTLRTPRDGRLDAVGIQIGNYRNTSDGSLVVEACVETECRRSRAALSESRDNQSFMLEMSDPLPVSEGAPLRLTLRREGGTRPLVFWSYGAVAGSAKVKVQEGRDHPRTVRIELEYAD